MMRVLILFITISFVVFNTGCKNKNEPVNSIQGKWGSLRNDGEILLTINFNDDNTFRTEVSRSNQLQTIDGRYKTDKDTMFICDISDKPTQVCDYNDTGIYIFTQHADTVLFKTLVDVCEKRKLTFEMGLDKAK